MTVNRTKLRVETYRLGAVRLYREDLEAIAKAVAEIVELEIVADDFESNDPFDFAELPEKLSEIRISAQKSCIGEANPTPRTAIDVELTPSTSTVTITEPDTLTSGVRTRIQEICRARLRSPQRTPTSTPIKANNPINSDAFKIAALGAVSTIIAATITAILALVATAIKLSTIQQSIPKINTLDPVVQKLTIGLMSLFVTAICWITFHRLARRVGATIVNAYQADRPTWWQRNRDNVLVSAVSLLLGGIIGYYVNQIS